MPSPTRTLSRHDVAEYVASRVFAPGPTGRVGIELEWVTVGRAGRPAHDALQPDTLRAALPDPLPGASRLTFEPGGQLELSGPAAPDLPAALDAMTTDTAAARAAFEPLGVRLVGTGLDPSGPRDRVLGAPRYRAMEQYFDTRWPAGRTMMRNTASVQVNLDIGGPGEVADRWQRAHELGPLLLGAFANSPLDARGRPTGWCSTRFAVWDAIDPARTGAVYRDDRDPCVAFTGYMLDAGVMMMWPDGPDGDAVVPAPGLRFGDWIDHGHEFGHPTLADLEYHLTTLFPPVRPRGWLELRMIDALPDECWPVAVAVATTLLDHPGAVASTDAALRSLRGRWIPAARHGLADPATRAAAEHCFQVTADALPDLGASTGLMAALDAYCDRYVDRGRSPAHDVLEARVAADGSAS